VSIYQYKSIGASFKDIDQSTMTVSGYLSAFDKVDSYGEVAVKGSFSKSLNENKERIRYLLNHDVNKSLGPFIELREDDYGLYYVAEVLPTSFGKDFMIMAERGIIREHSIGYKEMQSKEEKGVKYITEHKLFEGSSLTGWGVNQFTPMTSVSKSESEIQDRIKQLEAFIKNTTATDETIYLLMLEIKQLSQLVIDMKATKPETSTLPETKIDLVKIALLLNT
jgi:HK97 family phage prohead protease